MKNINDKRELWFERYLTLSELCQDLGFTPDVWPEEGFNHVDFLELLFELKKRTFPCQQDQEKIDKAISSCFGENNIEFVKTLYNAYRVVPSKVPLGAFKKDLLPPSRGIYLFFMNGFHPYCDWPPERKSEYNEKQACSLTIPLYFGVSNNLQQRFTLHHKMKEIELLNDTGSLVSFCYFTDTEFYKLPDNLFELELRLINVFSPLLNGESSALAQKSEGILTLSQQTASSELSLQCSCVN